MMQKIDARDERVTRLSALFGGSEVASAAHASDGPRESQPDPRVLIEKERERILEKAGLEGYELGMQRAQDEIRAAADSARRECEAAHAKGQAALEAQRERLASLLRQLPEMVETIEESVVDLAAELAYAALLRVLADMPPVERVANTCRRALNEQQQRPLVLRLSHQDAAVIEGLDVGSDVTLQADGRLHAGQCQIETGLGLHDTGLDVRLEQLRQSFLRGLSREDT